ncbi:MAG: GntR family transcriptional regulator [Gammaproteobacteria bacterium]|nr:GntR family transcriptional regulator [Gammaproteobacteria bacterium]
MKFSPISPQKISDSIAIHIEDLILNGLLMPGDKLPAERELAKDLQVSRTSLRDALVKLEARGLLQVRHSGGTLVRDIIGPTLTDQLAVLLDEHPEALLDLLEVREALERIAAYYAAQRATALDREILEQRFAMLNQSTDTGDPGKDAVAIVEYYLAIANASHNIALMHVMRGLYRLMPGSIGGSLSVIYQRPGTYETVHKHRREMHAAIMHGDADAAAVAANAVTLFLRVTFSELITVQPAEAKLQPAGAFSAVDKDALKPARLSDAVVAQIEKLITSGKLRAGDQLPAEKTLADILQVSRSVLRDAVVRLETRGVLNIKQGGGTFVCNVPARTINDPLANLLSSNIEAVFDFLHLRGSLEELCAAYAAERRDQIDLEQLQKSYIDIENGVKAPDPYRDAERITDFHIYLAEASHNVVLVHIMRGLYKLLRTSIRTNLERIQSNAGKYNLVLEHHRDILKAVEEQDVDAAANAASIHIDFINQSISQFGIEQKRLEQSRRRAESMVIENGY